MKLVQYDSPILKENLSGKLIQFMNARILRENKLVDDHLWVRDGTIINGATVFFEEKRRADIQVDCQDLILSPGFIDLQINGGFGVDFSTIPSSDSEYLLGLTKVSKNLLSHGVTSYTPTLITSSPETYHRVLPLLKKRNGNSEGSGILGAHLEGPFISSEKKGCHPDQHIKTFGNDPENMLQEVYGSLTNIAMVTLAPELPGSDVAIRCLVENGVVVSLGHSSASLKDGEKGFTAGARTLTHLFNAMQPYHHRDPGLIGLLTSKFLKDNMLYYGIISDGIHTHDSALRLAYRTYPEGLILVTDAIAALGMADGQHKMGELIINVKGLSAVLEGTTTTAGSVASMPLCIRHLMQAVHCSLEDALLCATKKPANLLGIAQNKGVLTVGADADLVLLSDSVEIIATFISGQLVYNSK